MTKCYCDVCNCEITEKNECSGGEIASKTRLGTSMKVSGIEWP